MKKRQAKKITLDQFKNLIRSSTLELKSNIKDLNRQNTEHLAQRILALEKTGLPITTFNEIQRELRVLQHNERLTRKVLEDILSLMGLSKEIFKEKQS